MKLSHFKTIKLYDETIGSLTHIRCVKTENIDLSTHTLMAIIISKTTILI